MDMSSIKQNLKRLRLSKKKWLAIGCGAFVIAGGTLGYMYMQLSDQLKEVEAQYDLAQNNLSRIQVSSLSVKRQGLEADLSESLLLLEDVKIDFQSTVSSSMVTRKLFDVADAHGFKVLEMTSSIPEPEMLNDVELLCVSVSATVQGNSGNIVAFTDELNESFGTGLIRSMFIEIMGTGNQSTLNIHVEIYSYPDGL